MIFLLSFIVACGQNSESGKAPAEESGSLSAADYEALPTLTVEYPERGSFDNNGSGQVRGKVSSDNDGLNSITINGESFPVDSTGRFAADMEWRPGIQILGTRAEAENGERAVDGRAFYTGPIHEPASWIASAIRMEVDSEILDDDDSEPDDVAGLIELALNDGTLLEPVIGDPIDLDTAVLTPTVFTFADAHIDLVPDEGAIDAVISLEGLEIACDVEAIGLVSTSGTASADRLDASVRMTVTSSGGDVRAETSDVTVWVTNLEYDISGIPDPLETMVAGWVDGLVENAIEDAIKDVMATYVENALEALAVGTTFSDNLGMDLRLSGLEVLSRGVRFEVDAKIEAVNGLDLPPGAGSMLTVGEPPPWPSQADQPLWAAVDDDLLNQLGLAFWQTGYVNQIELDPVLLGGLTGGPIPPPLGPIESVAMSLNLPPTIEPSKEEDWSAQIALGEWLIEFVREDGEVLEFSVSFRSNVQVDIEEDGQISLDVDARPSMIEQAIGVLRSPDALDPGDLSALIRLLVPPLLGNASSFAPEVPVPVIPLDEFIETPSTEGRELVAEDPTIQVNQEGWLVLKSGLKIR